MVKPDDLNLLIRFAEHGGLVETDDEDDYFDEQEGSIELSNCELDPEKMVDIKVGAFAYTLIDVMNANINDVSIYDVFDLCQGTFEIYQALYNPAVTTFKRDTLLATKLRPREFQYQAPNLIYFDKLVIYPEFARNGFGLLALRKLLHYRQGNALAVINPFPQQYYGVRSAEEARNNAKALGLNPDVSEPAAREKLNAHFARLKFNRVSGTPFLVRPAYRRLPSEEAMLGPQLPVAKSVKTDPVYESLVSRLKS